MQWKFQSTYLYGVVEPSTGENFFFEFPYLNSPCFQMFLELVAQAFPDDILIIQLDNAGFHQAKKLQIPHNIILFFQPPHCPESNAIEQVWQYLKRGLRWYTPSCLDQLRLLITQRLTDMTEDVLASITGRASVLEALSVVNI